MSKQIIQDHFSNLENYNGNINDWEKTNDINIFEIYYSKKYGIATFNKVNGEITTTFGRKTQISNSFTKELEKVNHKLLMDKETLNKIIESDKFELNLFDIKKSFYIKNTLDKYSGFNDLEIISNSSSVLKEYYFNKLGNSSIIEVINTLISDGFEWDTKNCLAFKEQEKLSTAFLDKFDGKKIKSIDIENIYEIINNLNNSQQTLLYKESQNHYAWNSYVECISHYILKNEKIFYDGEYLSINGYQEEFFNLILNEFGTNNNLFTYSQGLIEIDGQFNYDIYDFINAISSITGINISIHDEDEENAEDEEEILIKKGTVESKIVALIQDKKAIDIKNLIQNPTGNLKTLLNNGHLLNIAIEKKNIDAIDLLSKHVTKLTPETINLLVKHFDNYDVIIKPILKNIKNEALLKKVVAWQMSLQPSMINPRQQKEIFDFVDKLPNKNKILIESASLIDNSWKSPFWSNELNNLIHIHQDLFIESIKNAFKNEKFNYVRDCIKKIQVLPSEIHINNKNLLELAKTINKTDNNKLKNYNHMDVENFLLNFNTRGRRSMKVYVSSESFEKTLNLLENQITNLRKSKKIGMR